MLVNLIESVYRLLWGDLFTIPLGGGIGISFMVVLLFTAGIWFTCRTRLLPVRLFRDMIAAVCEKKQGRDGLSSFQTLVISTATRVGMGNLVAWWPLFLQAVPVRCSGCGSLPFWVRPPPLSNPPCPEIPPARPAIRRLRGGPATICMCWRSAGAAKSSSALW